MFLSASKGSDDYNNKVPIPTRVIYHSQQFVLCKLYYRSPGGKKQISVIA